MRNSGALRSTLTWVNFWGPERNVRLTGTSLNRSTTVHHWNTTSLLGDSQQCIKLRKSLRQIPLKVCSSSMGQDVKGSTQNHLGTVVTRQGWAANYYLPIDKIKNRMWPITVTQSILCSLPQQHPVAIVSGTLSLSEASLTNFPQGIDINAKTAQTYLKDICQMPLWRLWFGKKTFFLRWTL